VTIPIRDLRVRSYLGLLVATGRFEDVPPVVYDRADRTWSYFLTASQVVVTRSSMILSTTAPRAGRRIAVKGVRLTRQNGARIAATRITCVARLAGRRLAPAGACAWRLPASAAGKELTLSVTARHAGGTVVLTPRRLRVG
jgi:hypothetical protein